MDSEPEPEPEVADDPVDVPNQNPESYCRFCFSETDVEPLFPANQSKPAEEMYERLFECIGIRLTKEDYYPSGICWHCSLTMEEFQCFRKRCLKYDALVRRLQGGVKDTEPSPTIEAKDPQPSEEKQSIKLPGVIFRKGKKFKKKPLPTGDATVHPCPFCPRSFTRKMYFDQHMWKHRDLLQAAKAEGAGGGIKKTLLNRPIKQEKPWIPIAKPEASASTDNGSLVATGGKLKDASISCEYCPRKFTRRMYYMQHLRKHNAVKEGVVRCRYCPRNFVSTRSRRAHEKKDHYKIIAAENAGSKKPPFCCPQCSRTFKYRYSLRMHLLNHSGQLPHACDICNCRFYSMQYLAVHKKRYHGPDAICGEAGNESIISCLYCTRSFLRECDRSSHIKQMHGNIVSALNETEGDGQPELMDDCPPADTEGLTDPELLPPNVHEPMMEIKEEEPYANDPHRSGLPSGGMEPDNPLFYCYSCAMNFETEDMYAEHLDDQHPFGGEQMMEQLQSGSPTGEQEQGEKEFRCPYCPKTFTRKWSMNEHITSHLGTRRYPCELCPAIFCREGYLRTHRSRKHPNEAEKYNGTFKCRFCPRMFVMERYKKVHEKIAHIKKGDVLPEDNDTNSELALNDNSIMEVDESSCSVIQEPSCTSNDFDLQSISPEEAESIESLQKLVVMIQPIPLHVLVDYQWQIEMYESMPFDQPDTAPPSDEPDIIDESTNSSFQHDDSGDGNRKRTKIGITLHPCGLCTKMFKSRTALRKHSLYHSGALPHQCDECGVQFMRYGLLVDHKTRYHGENGPMIAARYSCDYCPRIFLRKQDRSCHHLMVHARDQAKALENDIDASPTLGHSKKIKKDYLCKVCGELYEKYRTCKRHINRAHPVAEGEEDIKPMKLCHCTICVGIFKKREDWNEHMEQHPKVQCHHCEQCIRRRRKKWGRKLIHRCSFCPKAFLHKPNLNSHLRIHQQQLRFPCGECDAMYDRYRDLATHKIRYHSDDSIGQAAAQYKCAYCPRVFMRPRDVNYHQLSVHADRANQAPVEQEDDLMYLDPSTLLDLADQEMDGEKPIKVEPDLD